jgi:hypothetical protein
MEENNLKAILDASYKPQVEAEKDLEKLGYKYDPELSSMDSKVFYDPKTNKPHIAYRGSVRVIDDWLDNIALGLGHKSKSVEESVGLAKQVQDKYGQAPDTYGHSRGGYKAEKAGEAVGGKTYTYNKATLPTDIFKSIRPEQTDVRTKGDIVSLPSYFQSGGMKKLIQPVNPFFNNIISNHALDNLGR